MNVVDRLKFKSPAADLALQDGKDWGQLSTQEKDEYLQKAYDARMNDDDSGLSKQVKDNDKKRQRMLNREMGR